MKPLSENTMVSIGMVLIIIGGATFITRVSFQSDANAKSIEEIVRSRNQNREQFRDSLEQIHTDMVVIKVKLDRIEKKLGE